MVDRISYITGSRAYGDKYKTNDSDYDLVVLADARTVRELFEATGYKKLMFGNLNIIAFNADVPEDVERYDRWLEAHNKLMEKRPNTKEEAIAVFREHDAESQYLKEQQ